MPLEYPEQTYIPSAKVKLSIRFDEYARFDRLEAQAKALYPPPKNLKGIAPIRGTLKAVPDSETGGFTLVGPNSTTNDFGQIKYTSTDNLTQVVLGIIPQEATWKQNGIRMPDTLSLTFRWSDFPMDPRTIRACAVEYYLGTVSPENYAAGLSGQTRTVNNGSASVNEPLHLVPDSYYDGKGNTISNKRFVGWIKKFSLEMTDSEQQVKCECTDNTSLLQVVDAPVGLVVNPKKPIDRAIADYLAEFPHFEGLTIVYQPTGFKPPVLGESMGPGSFPPKLGPPLAMGGGASGDSEKMTVWDYLTDICGVVGHFIRVEGLNVIIQPPRTLYDGRATARQGDPYTDLSANKTFPNRAFIYGRNISEYKVEREFGRGAPANIEMRCYSMAKKTTLVSRYPKPDPKQPPGTPPYAALARVLPGDGKVDTTWHIIRAYGINDQDTLDELAHNTYESKCRAEIKVDIKTKNMASFGGGNENPDILGMRVGDTVDIHVNNDLTGQSTIEDIQNSLNSVSKCVDFMKSLGYSNDFAQAYGKAYTDAQLQKSFRVKDMQIDWSIQDGVSFDISSMNYIEVRMNRPVDKNVDGDATSSTNYNKGIYPFKA